MGVPRWLTRDAGPRLAVAALALGSALLLPGVIVERARSAALPPAAAATPDPHGSVALFALECDAGVFAPQCLRELEQLTHALESDARVAGPVRSLARASFVSGEVGALRPTPLRVAPLVPELPAADEALRRVRARLSADPSLAARFVRRDQHASFVIAPLVGGLDSGRAGDFVESVRSRFDRPPAQRVDARLERVSAEPPWVATLLAPLFGAGCLLLALALAGARLAAAASLAGAAALFWLHGALAAGVGLQAASADLGRELALAGGICAALPLLHRARLELRRGASLAQAVASGAAFAAPPALIAAVSFLASGVLGPAGVIALVAALAAALLAAAALVPLVRSGGYASPLDPQLERALVRLDVATRAHPRVVVTLALALAVAAFAGILNQPAAPLRPAPPRPQRWVVDSGAPGGALEPRFLERVQALQAELATRPGVESASSLIDAVLGPAQRAAHDGDAAFATVPPTRTDVEATLALFAASAPAELAGRIDAERRRVEIDVLQDATPSIASHSAARALLVLAALFALSALWLRSALAAAVACAPAALAAAALVGAGAELASAALGAVAAALCALLVLARVRALAGAGAERSIAVSLALRDAGRPGAELALAGTGLAALGAPASLVVAPLLGVALGLVLTPVLARALAERAFAHNEPLRAEVSGAVGSIQRRGTDARR